VYAAVGSTLVVAAVLFAWNRTSLGAYATISGTDFADRFHPVSIPRQPRWMLALLAPGSTIDDPSEPEMQTISPESPDDIWSPYRLAVRPYYRPATTAKAAKVAQAEQVVPAATRADFSPPDFGELVVPAAALSLMTLSVAELAVKKHAAAKSSRASMETFATPAPDANPFTLPGPFHVFFTTGPADGASGASASGDSGSAGGGGGVAGLTNGVTSGVTGLTSGVTGLTSGVTGLTSGVTGLTGGVGNTVGAVVGNVGSGVGSVLGAVRR
jgi:hypothetical protein